MTKASSEIRSLARAHTETALKVLAGIMNDGSAPHAARNQAALGLLDRGWGKPAQAHTGEDGEGPIEHTGKIELVIIDPANSAA